MEKLLTIEENNGWISIDDKMPNIGEEVLVYWEDEYHISRLYNDEGRIEFINYAFDQTSAGSTFHLEPYLLNVKYWHPLPKPPQQQKLKRIKV